VSGIETVYLRAVNSCSFIVHFQFCVEDKNPQAFLNSAINTSALCSSPVSGFNMGPDGILVSPGNSGLVSAKNYNDWSLATVSTSNTGVVYDQIREFLSSPIFHVEFDYKYSCNGTFESGKGYRYNSCTKPAS
jgi:hypothetical protein